MRTTAWSIVVSAVAWSGSLGESVHTPRTSVVGRETWMPALARRTGIPEGGFVGDKVDGWTRIDAGFSPPFVGAGGRAPRSNDAFARVECNYAFGHGDAWARDDGGGKEQSAAASAYAWRYEVYKYTGPYPEGDWFVSARVHTDTNGRIDAGHALFHGSCEATFQGTGLQLSKSSSVARRTTIHDSSFGFDYGGFGITVPVSWVTGTGVAYDSDGDGGANTGYGTAFYRKHHNRVLVDVWAAGMSVGAKASADVHAFCVTSSTIVLSP